MKILIISLTCIIIGIPAYSHADLLKSNPPVLSYEAFLPDGISVEDIVSFELIEHGDVANIYRIETVDGKEVFEVLSSVAVNLLPRAAQYACLATIKNKQACNFVYDLGGVIIDLYGDHLTQKINRFWKAKIQGKNGYASIYSPSLINAKQAKKAFEESKRQTLYPWTAPNILTYKNAMKRYGDGR